MKRICLHQLAKPITRFPVQGVGDCRVCEPDEKNELCKMYTPVTLVYVEVTDEEKTIGYL